MRQRAYLSRDLSIFSYCNTVSYFTHSYFWTTSYISYYYLEHLEFGKSTCIQEMEGRYRGANWCSICLYSNIELIFVMDLSWQKKGYII
ncbi:hypothetical protein TSUD_111100 [Trifolium subterraneum]|uniref:Uncharacterized protein n=1 Tax=Trifolium subterraneum TaxID=3900 RepID=A0A2Z6MFD4_TRISU|nr:hypothetical protein TSUD_111100 [Trifolium subterraneum]